MRNGKVQSIEPKSKLIEIEKKSEGDLIGEGYWVANLERGEKTGSGLGKKGKGFDWGRWVSGAQFGKVG